MKQDDIIQTLAMRVAALESVVQMLISSHPERELVEKVAGAALAGLSSGAAHAGASHAVIEAAREQWGTMFNTITWPGRNAD